MRIKTKSDRRQRIKYRLRSRVVGTSERPRLAVFRSLEHIYAQAIDDATGKTMVTVSTVQSDVRSKLAQGAKGGNLSGAKQVGSLVAERLLAQGIKRIVFDRGGYLYHGRVKALADAAREGGLEF